MRVQQPVIKLRQFIADDLTNINARQYERDLIAAAGRDFGTEFALAGPAYTLVEDDAPIAAAGVFIMWPGVGEAWMHLSQYVVEKRPLSLYRFTDAMLTSIIILHKLRRVQCPICCDMQDKKRFVESLGFRPEGIMDLWGPDGCDYAMYARVAKNKEGLCLRQP